MTVPSHLPFAPESSHSRSLGALLARLLLGLALLSGGGAAAWLTVSRDLQPGLGATDTVQAVPLGSAHALRAELTTDRGDLSVTELPASSANSANQAARLQAHHRQFNPLQVEGKQQGSTLTLRAQLLVDPAPAPDTLNLQPGGQPVEHQLTAGLSAALPLDLNTHSGGGDQALDLRRLRLRSLTAVSRSGDQRVLLPARSLQGVDLSSRSGTMNLTATGGTALDSLKMESTSGELQANLSGAQVTQLSVGSQAGDIQVQLPRRVNAVLSSERGDLDVTLPAGASGQLHLNTERGSTSLNLPENTAFRLSFPELGPAQARARAAQLPSSLTFTDGAYLSPAARHASGNVPLLDIQLELPAGADLTLNLRTASDTDAAAAEGDTQP